MAALTIDVSQPARAIPAVTQLMQKYGSAETRTKLHQRWSIQTMNWIDQNFRAQGALTGSPWAALKPSTIAGRRKGKGKGGPQILQDTGALKGSFVPKFDSNAAVVGSPIFYAQYHEEGRKGPWEIRPKSPSGVLVFNNAEGKKVFAKRVMHPGYPARRILPRATDDSFMTKITTVAVNLFAELSK